MRLCGPATKILPPFIDWPENIKKVIKEKVYLAKGGYEFNAKPIIEIDEEELIKISKELIDNHK